MTEDVGRRISPEAWEQALLQVRRPAEIDYGALVAAAAVAAGIDGVDEWEDLDEREVVREVLEAQEVGTVGVHFPASTHGDAVWIAVSRFPGGTAVGATTSSYGAPAIAFVLPNATYDAVHGAALRVIADEQDGADWSVSEEGEEDDDDANDDDEPDGTSAVLFGFQALKQAWPPPEPAKASKRKKASQVTR